MKQLTKIETKLFELATPYLLVMSNKLHAKEVLRYAFMLLEAERGDRNIVIPAAILHDVGWSQLPENISITMRLLKGDPEKVKIHEERGSQIAESILKRICFGQREIEEIIMIINGHDTRKHALSQNDKIVKDADKLSRYSKAFCDIWPRWGLGQKQDLFTELERGVREWFFLTTSKQIAEKERLERIQEKTACRFEEGNIENKYFATAV